MTQKQIECGGWNTRRAKTAHFERRPVLCGYDAFNRMVTEDSRARLIAQIVNPVECFKNEFGSYFYGSQNNNPKQSVISHAAYSPDRRKRPIISSYPSMVGLRWNPNVETSSVEHSQTEITNDQKFHCKCESCRMKYCRAKNPSSGTPKPTFKNNIMTFSDKGTMTPMLKDAFCAACSAHSLPKTSDVSVTASTTCRDMQNGISPSCSPECGPVPILKKQNYYECDRCGYRNETNVDVIQQPERDVDICEDYQECFKPKCIKSIFKLKKKEKNIEIDAPRKTIYNEGINDIVTNRYPVPSRVVPSKINLNAESSRVSIASKSIPTKFNIPYSHKNHSKYHGTCRTSSTRLRCDDNDELKHLVASPEVLKRCYVHKPVKHPKLPRKLLTSERDIESYVEKSPKSNSGKGKKRKGI